MVEERISIVFDTKGAEKVNSDIQKMSKSTKDLSQQMRSIQGAMLNFGLSTMFMGMAIQRLFQSIAQSTIDTFMKINAGATPASRAIAAMSANFEFLKYTIGDVIGRALMPLLPLITDIVDKVADWVQQNPELTAGIILAGLAIGTFMMVAGQLLLFFNGVIGAIGIVAPLLSSTLANAFISLNAVALNLGATLGVSGLTGVLVGFITIVAGVISILALIWGALEFTERRSDFLGRAFERLTGTVDESLTEAEQITYSRSRNMARFWTWLSETFLLGFQYVATTGVGVFVAGFKYLQSFFAGIVGGLVNGFNAILNGFRFMLNGINSVILGMPPDIRKMFGIGLIDTSGIDNLSSSLQGLANSMFEVSKESADMGWEQLMDTGLELQKIVDDFHQIMADFDTETINELNRMEFNRGREGQENNINQDITINVGDGVNTGDVGVQVGSAMNDVNLQLLQQLRQQQLDLRAQGIDVGGT